MDYDTRRLIKRAFFHSMQCAVWLALASPLVLSLGDEKAPAASPPIVVHQFHILNEPVLLSNGSLLAVALRYRVDHQVVTGQTSSDDGRTWSEEKDLEALPRDGGAFGYYKAFVDRHGEVHLFLLADSDTGAGLPVKGKSLPIRKQVLDIWQVKTRQGGTIWEPARRIWQGRAGDLLSVIQLHDGRIILPICYTTTRTWRNRGGGFGDFTYLGQFETGGLYSDDGGETWQQSPSRLNIQTADLFEEGAIEPIVLELKDGRVWMLIRGQSGRFYESFSKDGADWSPPQPTDIVSSDSPAGLLRLNDGRIFMLVNDCQNFPYALGGRHVLIGAVSEDEGRTWHGYREMIRDPLRNEPPQTEGDFGVSYPFPTLTADGKVLFTMGVQSGTRSQTPEGPAGVAPGDKRTMVLVDPKWLDETRQQSDFSQGLDDWSVFGTKGVELIPDPEKSSSQVLLISKTSADWPAGAVWNFPSGQSGHLNLRVMLRSGFQGTFVGLTDEFSPPWDQEDQYHNMFNILFGPDGTIADGPRIELNRWHDIELKWDCRKSICQVVVDEREASSVPLRRAPQTPGICYLRLRSAALTTDPEGLLVRFVSAEVEPQEQR
jgi:hypothetical protein